MDKLKRAILCVFPMSICNFRCSYCYLSQRDEAYQGKQTKFKYSPEHIGKAFSIERLGGTCYFNFCADGETLLQKDIDKYIYDILRQGHYGEIVTNLTVTPIIEKILNWDRDILRRIEFKCSFHYLELKKRNLLEVFASNVKKIWEAGASACIEITPSDELIPFLEEIKEFSLKNFGALPHLSIARNDRSKGIEYLTDLSMEEYDRIWGEFKSEFWQFKKEIFGQKRKEYCYAGKWSLFVNMESGIARQCYCSNYEENIFEDIEKPIRFIPIGKCKISHCYNGHALLTLGLIPELKTVGYGDIRDRTMSNGNHWLQPELKMFFNQKLENSNTLISDTEKIKYKAICMENQLTQIGGKMKNKFFKNN